MSERASGQAEPSAPPGIVESENAYQLTLRGLTLPTWLHCAFNGVGLAAVVLLGHPVVGLAAFVASCTVDAVGRRVVLGWIANSAAVDEQTGFRRVALIGLTRVTTYLAGPALLAINGGAEEFGYLGVIVASMIAVACATGSLSRIVFWSFAGPCLLALVGVTLVKFPMDDAAGLLVGIGFLATLLALISNSTTQAISGWHAAFSSNLALIPELEAARDHAVAARTAADEAREDARRANRAKSMFLATMSHEIRTPMNGVLGMAQLLRREEGDPRQIERLETLIESGEYLLTILNDILDVSKVDAGRLEIIPHAEDLPLFLDRLVAFWGARADENGIALKLETDDSLPNYVWMDAIRMRQVLFNLIGNALKFTEVGSVTVGVSAQPHGDSAVRLRFSVTDTGPGIPAEHLPTLFDRFSQVDESENRKFGGTGLGLAIVKQLTELMGGDVQVESELGRGSAFHVEGLFDLAQAPADVSAEPLDDEPPMENLDLLIVDDNPVNLLVLEQILLACGHRVEKAADGQAALDLLAQRPFDLTLMDNQMPVMTGAQALERLRSTPGPNQNHPVIALTADVTSGGRSHYLSLGFTEHCSKPIQIPDLMGAVARAMSARAPRASLAG